MAEPPGSPDGGELHSLVQIICDGVVPLRDFPEHRGWRVQRTASRTVLTGWNVDDAAVERALRRLDESHATILEVRRRAAGPGRLAEPPE
jgi:hypothetical protein